MPEIVNRRAGDRLSFFSDGQRMLLQSDAGIYVVSVAERQLEKITLPALVDAELDNAPITRVHNAWAGPGDGEITFSGFIKDKAQVEHQRIYSCKFDGSDLKALTAQQNESTSPQLSSVPTKTAFELSKEIASAKMT